MFRVTARLMQCRITMFSRENCSLCDTAKAVVGKVGESTPFEYHEINVMEPGQERWKSVYEFDTPVVRSSSHYISPNVTKNPKIHVDKASSGETTAAARKLMHRFKEEEVKSLIDQVEQS